MRCWRGWLLPAKLLAEVAMENSGAFRLRFTQAIRRRNQRKALGRRQIIESEWRAIQDETANTYVFEIAM